MKTKSCIKIIFLAIVLMAFKKLSAQSCSGEIVHFRETFGAGTGNAPLAAGRTNYNYNGTSSLNDGDYKLNKSSQGRPEWHNAADHTGNTDGRMMITNASYTPGEFYRDTVSVLNANSFYSVFLYVMNLNKPTTCGASAILPKLEFIVESYNQLTGTFTHLVTFTSGYFERSETPNWVLTGGYFTLPAGVTAVRYRILNNSTGGCGNDLAIDDITFAQCPSLALPVSGLKLNTQLNNAVVEINWSTLQEINTSAFRVEKSANGKSWDAIATIKAAGKSQTKKQYRIEDKTPYQPVTYYRILQTDEDGKLTYSNIDVVRMSAAENGFSAYPNPFNAAVKLSVNVEKDQSAIVRITDINGRIVTTLPWQLKKGLNARTINELAGNNSGIFFAEVNSADGTAIAKTKLVKL